MRAVIDSEFSVYLTAEDDDEDAALDLIFRSSGNLIVGRSWDGHVRFDMKAGSSGEVCPRHGYPMGGNRVCSRCEVK